MVLEDYGCDENDVWFTFESVVRKGQGFGFWSTSKGKRGQIKALMNVSVSLSWKPFALTHGTGPMQAAKRT